MNTTTIGAFEAKTHLSELLERVREGRSFLIAKRGRPIAELRPVEQRGQRARFGCDRERIRLGDDFDEPIPDMQEYGG